MKWKSLSRVQLFATPWKYSPWNSPGKNRVGSLSLLQGIFPTQGYEPRSPALQVDSLPAEPPGKPKNTGVSSFPLLQQLYLTQESNRGLLHCRQILPTKFTTSQLLISIQLRVCVSAGLKGICGQKWILHKIILNLQNKCVGKREILKKYIE